jgi:secreted PhoX family phosphatase
MSLTLLCLTAAAFPQGPVADPTAPLSSLAVVQSTEANFTIPELTRRLVQLKVNGNLPAAAFFPLANTTTDTVRSIRATRQAVVIKWLDPLDGTNTGETPRFGANCDYVSYFGDGWNADWAGGAVGSAPQFNGSGSAGWIWINHEYISNSLPESQSAPSGQHLTHAKLLEALGVLNNDVTSDIWEQGALNAYDFEHKRQLGGSWVRIVKDAQTGAWSVDRSAQNKRYDATGATQVRVTGIDIGPTSDFLDHADDGSDNAASVVSGIMGDCSGATTPWGTILTAEENVQGYFGDFEATWSSGQRFIEGNGFDPGSNVSPTYEPSRSGRFGRITEVQARHTRDLYGYLTEIDPGADSDNYYEGLSEGGDGLGHRKLGAMGRARWENATFATGPDGRLVNDQPVVIYAGNDRRGGRIWKFVTAAPYTAGMTKAEVRDLLDTGKLYVAHFADLDNTTGQTLLSNGALATEVAPGAGRWVEFSLNSTDTPPNAAALAQPTITVGEALQNTSYNGIGGFPTDTLARKCLFTAATKLGVMELNRPEDLEYNPNDLSGTPRIYVAFTNHTRQVACDQNGVLYPPASHAANSPNRGDNQGSVMAMQEGNAQNPGASTTFTFFTAWRGSLGQGVYDAAAPDNLMIDSIGGVWFGTDGNFSRNGTADGVYYLDMDPSHKAGAAGVVEATFGLAFRVAAVPADAEATGPAFTSDEMDLFIAVQHPGESQTSTWPQDR